VPYLAAPLTCLLAACSIRNSSIEPLRRIRVITVPGVSGGSPPIADLDRLGSTQDRHSTPRLTVRIDNLIFGHTLWGPR